MMYKGFCIIRAWWDKKVWEVVSENKTFDTLDSARQYVDEKTNKYHTTIETRNKILKGVLLLRKFNTYQSKEEQLDEITMWMSTGGNEKDLDEWIESLKRELNKTPEEREREMEEQREQYEEYHDPYWDTQDDYRDEWDDLWADRARSCGAVAW